MYNMRKLKLLPVFGVAVFIYLIYQAGAANIIDNIRAANVPYLGMAFLLFIPIFLIKIAKWRYLVGTHNKYKFSDASESFLASYFLSLITPGKIGDSARAFYLKKDTKITLGRAFSTVVMDRLIDISAIIVLAFLGILYFTTMFGFVFFFNILIILCVFLISFLILILKKNYAENVLKRIFPFIVPKKYREKYDFKYFFHDFYDGIGVFIKDKKLLFPSNLILSVAAIFLGVIQIEILSMALNIKISLTFLMFIMPVIFLSEIVPISISGMGTRDAVMIFFLSFLSISSSSALSLSITILILNYAFGAFCSFFWFKKPLGKQLIN